jgi:hypothetical protein
MKYQLNLQRFTEMGEAAAEPAVNEATAPAAENADTPVISEGETLPTGEKASKQVAAAMNQQMKRHPELRKVYGQGRTQGKAAQEAPANPEGQTAEKTIEERWEEAKKGEFADLYGRDVQSAIQDRFKNQQDIGQQLNALEPMLKVFRDRAGVKTNEELIQHVMDDDSLYEDEANEAGMTVQAYRQFREMQEQRDRLQRQQEQAFEQQQIRNHVMKLEKQAEEFKQQFPDFDLWKTLKEDETFKRLTSPSVGLSVKDAYFAIHHDELAPQMMAYGMERAKQQMGQTLQAQRRRPAEGAMKAQGQAAADIKVDPRKLSRPERNRLYEMIHKGKQVSFD